MSESNKIVCGDSLTLLREMKDESVELIVTSPPYNVGIHYDVYNDSRPLEDYHQWLGEVCCEMYRVVKPNCNIFINICDVGVSNRDAISEEYCNLAKKAVINTEV